jgi:hypothetical protein
MEEPRDQESASPQQPPEEAQGLDERTLRRLLTACPSRDLVDLLLKGVRENRTFRRKVLAWLIDAYADDLPAASVRAEIGGWIDDAFAPGRSLMPRTPAIRDLGAVRTAVRRRPRLAVYAHLAVVGALVDFLRAYGGGPESLYAALVRHFEWAAEAAARVDDEHEQLAAVVDLEEFVVCGADFGCGIDRAAAAALESHLGHLYPDRDFHLAAIEERYEERRRRRRGWAR